MGTSPRSLTLLINKAQAQAHLPLQGWRCPPSLSLPELSQTPVMTLRPAPPGQLLLPHPWARRTCLEDAVVFNPHLFFFSII